MLILFAVLVGMLTMGLVIWNVFNWAFDKGRQSVDVGGAIDNYKAEQIWEYEDRPTPYIRRNRLTGQIQKRYEVGDMLNRHVGPWRTVMDLDLKKELKHGQDS